MKAVLDHIVINAFDVEVLLRFYSDLLEFPSVRLEEWKQGQVPFPSVRLNEATIIDLFPAKLWKGESNAVRDSTTLNVNHFCITLEKGDWDHLVKKLAQHNIQPESGPKVLFGAKGNGTSVYIRDPENNLVELRYYDYASHCVLDIFRVGSCCMHTSPRVSKGSLDYTLRFFHTLLTQDEAARKQALDRILWQLENSLQGSDQGQLFVAHIATITRFASEVPFSDVREAFSRLLERAETTLPVHSPVYSMVKEYQRLRRPIFSRFIPNDQLPTVQNANSVTLRLFTDNFLFTGRISTVVRVMAFFPSYLEAYIQSYRAIMRRPGPLPETWRNYLGLMAGARLRCSYIVHMQETEFLLHGGDIRWLESDENVPPKLLVIRELNAILAHQPWLLKSEHLQRLAHPASSLGGQVSWSLSECVLAILIFSHFHSLAGFIEGCGLCPDIDMDSRDSLVRLLLTREQDGGGTEEEEMATKTNDALQSPPSEVEATRQLVEKLKRAIILQEDTSYSDSGDQQQFAKSASIDSNSHEHRSWNSDGSFTEAMEAKYSRIAGFTEYYPLKHEDFDVNSKTYKIFHIHEYNWSDHGYALINAFYEDGELASLLDKQFDIIYHLTDNSIGMNANVDTSIFRRAIWVYVHRLMGIMHDDYDYRLVNLILKQPLKAFIKKVACKPETISRNDFERMGLALRPEEKVQIVLLSMEARKQAELLYGLHAILKWMNQDSDD